MPCRPLIEVVAEIPDHRQARGKRYPLGAVLVLACVATMCGYRSYSAMAEWAKNYGDTVMRSLGFGQFTRPCAATLHAVFKGLDVEVLEECLGRWAQSILEGQPGLHARGVAIDGKTVRGSKKHGAPGTHLLSAVSHALGLTLFECAVDDKTNEITAIHTVLKGLVLTGRIITVDALLTQRPIAQGIVEKGGDYVMVAKDNQSKLRQTIEAVLATPSHLAAPIKTASTTESTCGFQDQRHLHLRALLPGDCDWPHAQQVFRLDRRRVRKATGEVQTETIVGITSLAAQDVDARDILQLVRRHWVIENSSHWIRDVTFDEDRSQVHCGVIPQTMAALRNAAIGAMRAAGHPNIAASCRRFAAQPTRALALVGVTV